MALQMWQMYRCTHGEIQGQKHSACTPRTCAQSKLDNTCCGVGVLHGDSRCLLLSSWFSDEHNVAGPASQQHAAPPPLLPYLPVRARLWRAQTARKGCTEHRHCKPQQCSRQRKLQRILHSLWHRGVEKHEKANCTEALRLAKQALVYCPMPATEAFAAYGRQHSGPLAGR